MSVVGSRIFLRPMTVRIGSFIAGKKVTKTRSILFIFNIKLSTKYATTEPMNQIEIIRTNLTEGRRNLVLFTPRLWMNWDKSEIKLLVVLPTPNSSKIQAKLFTNEN